MRAPTPGEEPQSGAGHDARMRMTMNGTGTGAGREAVRTALHRKPDVSALEEQGGQRPKLFLNGLVERLPRRALGVDAAAATASAG
jgi:hypothetical protein